MGLNLETGADGRRRPTVRGRAVRSAHAEGMQRPAPCERGRRTARSAERGGRVVAAAGATDVLRQLQGPLKTAAAVYDVDGFETTAVKSPLCTRAASTSSATSTSAPRRTSGPTMDRFPKSVLGAIERLARRALARHPPDPVWSSRSWRRGFACAQKGFDAVEPDNIEAFSNKSGFPVTAAQQLAYNLWVAETVHGLGMAVLQKNDGEQTRASGAELRRRPHRAVQPVLRMRRLRPLPGRRQAGDQRRVQAEDEALLRRGRSRGDRRGTLQPGPERPALRTLLVAARR